MRRTPRIITLSPGGVRGVWATLAASRAGAVGVLDLDGVAEFGHARDAVGRVGRLLKGRTFGVRLGAHALDAFLAGGAPENLGVVIVSAVGGDGWAGARERLARAGAVVLGEVRSRDEAAAAVAAGVSGLVV